MTEEKKEVLASVRHRLMRDIGPNFEIALKFLKFIEASFIRQVFVFQTFLSL